MSVLLALFAAVPKPALPQEPVAVPFVQPRHADGSGPILFEVEAGGLRARALLDTGAGRSILSRSLAQRLELPSGPALPVAGVGGGTSAAVAVLPELAIGGRIFENLAVSVLPLDSPGFERIRFDLILGSDLLRRCFLEIDFDRSLLLFSPPEWGESAEGYRFQELGWAFGIPTVLAEAAGRPARFLLDTGNTAITVLNRPFFREGFESAADHPSLEIAGVGGGLFLHLGRLENLRLAGLDFPGLAAGTPGREEPSGLMDMTLVDGVIGMAVLRDFRLAFDYERNRAGFAPGIRRRHRPVRAGPGLLVLPGHESARVGAVVRGSPAEEAGLGPGWLLLEIDGETAAGRGATWLQEALEGDAGSLVSLRLEDPGGRRFRQALRRVELHPPFRPKAAASQG